MSVLGRLNLVGLWLGGSGWLCGFGGLGELGELGGLGGLCGWVAGWLSGWLAGCLHGWKISISCLLKDVDPIFKILKK